MLIHNHFKCLCNCIFLGSNALKRLTVETSNAPLTSLIQELVIGRSAKSLLGHSYIKDCLRDIKEMRQDWQIAQMREQMREMNLRHDKELEQCKSELRGLKAQMDQRNIEMKRLKNRTQTMANDLQEKMPEFQKGKLVIQGSKLMF